MLQQLSELLVAEGEEGMCQIEFGLVRLRGRNKLSSPKPWIHYPISEEDSSTLLKGVINQINFPTKNCWKMWSWDNIQVPPPIPCVKQALVFISYLQRFKLKRMLQCSLRCPHPYVLDAYLRRDLNLVFQFLYSNNAFYRLEVT